MKTKSIKSATYKSEYSQDQTKVAANIPNSLHKKLVRGMKKTNNTINNFINQQIREFVKTV